MTFKFLKNFVKRDKKRNQILGHYLMGLKVKIKIVRSKKEEYIIGLFDQG